MAPPCDCGHHRSEHKRISKYREWCTRCSCTDYQPLPDPSIDDLKALQRRLGLLDTHVVYIGAERFVVAHTDAERVAIDLETCELHGWLHGLDGPPAEIGYYTALPHWPDSRSETYMADPWDLEPLPSLYSPTGVQP